MRLTQITQNVVRSDTTRNNDIYTYFDVRFGIMIRSGMTKSFRFYDCTCSTLPYNSFFGTVKTPFRPYEKTQM